MELAVKNPLAKEMWVRSLCQQDALEEEMATCSRILAWKNPMDRGAWQALVHGVRKERDTTERLKTRIHAFMLTGGKGIL